MNRLLIADIVKLCLAVALRLMNPDTECDAYIELGFRGTIAASEGE
jgi:hypothetical protein